MKSFERYRSDKGGSWLSGLFSDIMWRIPSDKVILPVIHRIRNKKVCDVGCGTGTYSGHFLSNGNYVVGVDKNPQLCKADIRVFDEDASNMSHVFRANEFDTVFSGWMTEYLTEGKLLAFFKESNRILKPGGVFITTVVTDEGWGNAYVSMARIVRRVQKFGYDSGTAFKYLKQAGFSDIRCTEMRSWFNIKWADLFMAYKT